MGHIASGGRRKKRLSAAIAYVIFLFVLAFAAGAAAEH